MQVTLSYCNTLSSDKGKKSFSRSVSHFVTQQLTLPHTGRCFKAFYLWMKCFLQAAPDFNATAAGAQNNVFLVRHLFYSVTLQNVYCHPRALIVIVVTVLPSCCCHFHCYAVIVVVAYNSVSLHGIEALHKVEGIGVVGIECIMLSQ